MWSTPLLCCVRACAGPRGGEKAKDVHRGATINFVVVTDHHLTGME